MANVPPRLQAKGEGCLSTWDSQPHRAHWKSCAETPSMSMPLRCSGGVSVETGRTDWGWAALSRHFCLFYKVRSSKTHVRRVWFKARCDDKVFSSRVRRLHSNGHSRLGGFSCWLAVQGALPFTPAALREEGEEGQEEGRWPQEHSVPPRAQVLKVSLNWQVFCQWMVRMIHL